MTLEQDPPECLVISGGGMKGYGMLGAIKYLDEIYGLDMIHRYVGTSVGSILGYLLCLGYLPLDIIHHIFQLKVLEQLRSFTAPPEALFSQYGLIEFEPILEFLELMTLSKYGRLFTMETLHNELQKDFACMTYNFTKMRTELLHWTTTPHLPCLKAIQMSSSIPYVFTQCIHQDQVYIDGGIVDNFPLRAAFKIHPNKCIFGIFSSQIQNPSREISLVQLLTLTVHENQKRTIRKYRKRCRMINIALSNQALDFNMDLPGVMEMFSQGYRECEAVWR